MKNFDAIYRMWDALYTPNLPCQVRCTKVLNADKTATYVVIVDSPGEDNPSRRFIATESSLDIALSEVIGQMTTEAARVRDLLIDLVREFGG